MDIALDADREVPIFRFYETVEEARLREVAADRRTFAKMDERGLVDELARNGNLRRYP